MNANPGDLVVCVMVGRCQVCDPASHLPDPELGRAYRVSAVYTDSFGLIYDLAEFGSDPDWGFCDRHFRKLNDSNDDAELIERIKSRRPEKVSQ